MNRFLLRALVFLVFFTTLVSLTGCNKKSGASSNASKLSDNTTKANGICTIFDKTHSINTASLILYKKTMYNMLFIEVEAGDEEGGLLRIDCLPVYEIERLDDLDGGCMHYKWYNTLEDDTLGTNSFTFLPTSRWYFGGENENDDSKFWVAQWKLILVQYRRTTKRIQ